MEKIFLSFLISTFIFMTPFLFAKVTVDANAPKHQQPGINKYIEERKSCKAQDVYCQGAVFTTINITTPTDQGVSYNKYEEFNLLFGRGHNKIFFNNLKVDGPGFVGNPNLIEKSAKIILNEVTSNKRTELYGSLAVIGATAHVIIANPFGIRCNNCQFNNTNHVTLTTGTPVFSRAGNLMGYHVAQGNISIDRNGLRHNDNFDNYLDLFSASLTIDGEIRSGDIAIATGKLNINHAPIGKLLNIKPIYDYIDEYKTNLVVDVTQLGGMYANKIFIFAKSGGIKNKGVIDAREIANLISTSFINNANGRISAPKIKIRSGGNIDNTRGRIKSDRQGLDFKVDEKFGIRISGHNVNNKTGSIYANSGLTSITADYTIDNTQGMIKSNASAGSADIKLKAKIVDNDYGNIITSQDIQIDTNELSNNKGRIVSAFSDIELRYKAFPGDIGVIYGGINVTRILKP
ncbi:two-partner secretion domain-containing protein [Yersinia proxima]|uniref:two-partner secretion domain-containing protein n=1 Tax=Yersinia proxima TaxID=2890316 RepID=UPI001D119A3A|nr:filamentous hemagglutinin N-terminal domain-containing protein [Yersinia proxima]